MPHLPTMASISSSSSPFGTTSIAGTTSASAGWIAWRLRRRWPARNRRRLDRKWPSWCIFCTRTIGTRKRTFRRCWSCLGACICIIVGSENYECIIRCREKNIKKVVILDFYSNKVEKCTLVSGWSNLIDFYYDWKTCLVGNDQRKIGTIGQIGITVSLYGLSA